MRQSTLDWVMTDEAVGAHLAVEHLVALGHSRIVHIDGGRGAGGSAAPRGLPEGDGGVRPRAVRAWSCRASSPRPRASRASSSCWRAGPLPTAIFAANDLVAAGALDRVEDEGLRVPEDISIVGFDNTFLAALHHMSLTTVDQPRAEMGRLAFELLLERIDGRTARVGRLLEPGLVARKTSGPAPKAKARKRSSTPR